MRALQSRSEIVKAFYSKQMMRDSQIGLSRQEFELLKAQLDDASKDKFHQDFVFALPSFEEFELDNNGNMNILDFEQVAKREYEVLLRKRLTTYRKTLSKETKAYEKEEKRRQSMTEDARLVRRMSSFSAPDL